MAKLSKFFSSVLLGLEARKVIIEAYVDSRAVLHDIDIVGLGDTSVKESKKRVKSAIYSNDFPLPMGRIVINLAPGDLKKEGTLLDLPIAMSILSCAGTVKIEPDEDIYFFGELGLDGEVRKIRGLLPILISLAKSGRKSKVIVPAENGKEALLAKNEKLRILCTSSLRETVGFLNGINSLSEPSPSLDTEKKVYENDFSEIKGQYQAKRAMEIAAAGGHNIFLKGPPGSGKTMLAKALPSILPPLTDEEFLETASILSISGNLDSKAFKKVRPFRSPHHSASRAALIGGGPDARPGEVSLAHNGVLFLDELPEFSKYVLESLRQPLEDGVVNISRAKLSVTYPARFSLVSAQNPCPCGNFGDPERQCRCLPREIISYNKKISGPLLDRMDLIVEVPRMSYLEFRGQTAEESSEKIRERVEEARNLQRIRFRQEGKVVLTNSSMGNKLIKKYCLIDSDSEKLLEKAVDKFKLTGRGINKILKVSRTIADLSQKDKIEISHVAEAIQYREKNREEEKWM